MAFRGRGRGRGRGGFGGGFGFGGAIPEPYTLFPEDVALPEISNVSEETTLVYWNLRLLSYWKSSPYYLEGSEANNTQDIDIERYSDRKKPKGRGKRDPLSLHLKLAPAYFPQELVEGSRVQHNQRKVRWNPELGEQKLDLLEQLEQQHEAKGDKDDKDKKKEAEDEDEDEEGVEEEDESMSDDDDYKEGIHFDDDEDDFNMEDEGNDEPMYGGDDDY